MIEKRSESWRVRVHARRDPLTGTKRYKPWQRLISDPRYFDPPDPWLSSA